MLGLHFVSKRALHRCSARFRLMAYTDLFGRLDCVYSVVYSTVFNCRCVICEEVRPIQLCRYKNTKQKSTHRLNWIWSETLYHDLSRSTSPWVHHWSLSTRNLIGQLYMLFIVTYQGESRRVARVHTTSKIKTANIEEQMSENNHVTACARYMTLHLIYWNERLLTI